MTAGSGPSGLRLIESLRWDGELHRTEMHLRRMERSAARLGRPFDEAEARRRLSRVVAGLEGPGLRKVRLTLGPGGELAAEAVDVDPAPEPADALIVDVRVDPEDELLYHKTDRRERYDAARARARRRGCWEAVLLNTRGEVTEGSFTNVFVRAGDAWYTPPVSCGLLPGVYRRAALERLDGAEERVLRPGDVLAADEVRLCNSVRGFVRARAAVEGEVGREGGPGREGG